MYKKKKHIYKSFIIPLLPRHSIGDILLMSPDPNSEKLVYSISEGEKLKLSRSNLVIAIITATYSKIFNQRMNSWEFLILYATVYNP